MFPSPAPTETVRAGESACAQMKIATSLVAQFGGQLKDGRFTVNLFTVLTSDLESGELMVN